MNILKIPSNSVSANGQVVAQLPVALLVLLMSCSSVVFAQTPPPSFGEETKGTPALDERAALPPSVDESNVDKDELAVSSESAEIASENEQTSPSSILGSAKITELRRENGQVYEIELEHSLGSKQYIQENDSDGKIESTSNDIEETPNLAKWRLGSW